MKKLTILLLTLTLNISILTAQSQTQTLNPIDVFDLEFASDPQVSPDGQKIIYQRNFKDIMTDANRSNLWVVNYDGSQHHPLTTGKQNDRSPRWTPDGQQCAYISSRDGSSQIYLRWLSNGAEAKISNLTGSPSGLSWSPDGKWLAFTMFVPQSAKPLVALPSKPAGAKWNDVPKYIDKLKYRSDGAGYLKDGFRHVFLLSKDGGAARQLTNGDFNYSGTPQWSKDGTALYISSNQHPNREFDPANSEIFRVDIKTGKANAITTNKGPDRSPTISPDGKTIAYLGYEDKFLGYQQSRLQLMNIDGSNSKMVLKDFDRNVENIQWANDGSGLFFQYNEEGNTYIAFAKLDGTITKITDNVGGLSLGRPYSGGTFNVSGKNNNIAFTHSTPDHPADLATTSQSGKVNRITRLNDDLFGYKALGEVEEIWYNSSHDNQKIQGWICKPPNFDASKKYPLILEIHGGPFTNYGSRFSAEVQLYAAAGYVVLYTNPRGSTSYGADFGNLIHHNYPSEDHDDLMSGVDAVIAKGYIDTENLFITGGSGGGVLSSWAIGKTDRFRAAVVAKPVINWYSFVLHADNPAFFYKYWFPGKPWENQEEYMKRSPISLVGNVKTPTMLLTGEVDYRTPMSETEQYYAALKLQGVESAMVRIQNSGHGIANQPSNLISKVMYILAWFEKYKK